MSYVAGYIPSDDWGRVCDVCARLRPGRTFRVADGVWICDRHPSYVPRQSLDRVPYIELGAPKPLPSAKPWTPVDTYEVAEGEVLNLIAQVGPGDTLDVTTGAGAPLSTFSVGGCAWASLYLYDLIAEAKRPVRWITMAKATLATLADALYSNQKGGPGVTGYTNADLQWGAYNSASSGESYFAEFSAAAGLALLRAYQVLGTTRYLDAARACAWFLRSAQCGDKLVSRPSSSDAAGSSPYHYGTWTGNIQLNGAVYDFNHRYSPDELIALEFLNAYKAAVGDEVIGSSAITAVFSASRAAAVSTCIAEAIAFWTGGAYSVDDGAIINGFSTATPRAYFDAYPVGKGLFTGRGSWVYEDGSLPGGGGIITSRSWAVGMRALRALGYTSTVEGIFDWLMTFSSNPAKELTTTTHTYGSATWNTSDDRGVYAGIAGTYNPKLAPATILVVRSAGQTVLMNSTALYDLAAAGLLAPLYSARQQSSFATLKDALVIPRPRYREGCVPRDGQVLSLAPLGVCGLSFQPYTTTALARVQTLKGAALTANVFRYAPQAYTGRGH